MKNPTVEYAKEVWKALVDCGRLWREVGTMKYGVEEADAKSAAIHETGLTLGSTGCPACDFYDNWGHTELSCRKVCILNCLWPSGCVNDNNSPFRSWSFDEGTQEDALKIARHCEEKAARIKAKWGF